VSLLLDASNLTSIPDTVLLAILVLGTYRRNVFSAVALVIFSIVGSTWIVLRILRNMDVVVIAEFVLFAVAFAHCYYLGAVGAIRYKQLVRSRRKEPIETEVIGVVVAFGLLTMSLLTAGIPA
jgi:hypothetical protein